MKSMMFKLVAGILLFLLSGVLYAEDSTDRMPHYTPPQNDGTYYELLYPRPVSPKENELEMAVEWRLWIPPEVKKLRGIVIHQHGCGIDSCDSGRRAVYDLHWQELARRHDCALMAASYHQECSHPKHLCMKWCDPRKGSGEKFFRALNDFARLSGHSELTVIPWALWGHSGGAHWCSEMLQLYPERIVCVWLRSGHPNCVCPTFDELPKTEAMLQVPVVLNLGRKEHDMDIVWNDAWPYFQTMRSLGAKFGLLIDPLAHHECNKTRYPAIAFIHEILTERLPEQAGDSTLRPYTKGVIVPIDEISDQELGQFIYYSSEVTSHPHYYLMEERREFVKDGCWFPSQEFITIWRNYSVDQTFVDTTPPPAPTEVKIIPHSDGTALMTWKIRADLESGLETFLIYQDGALLEQMPSRPGDYCRPTFQGVCSSDSPQEPMVYTRYIIREYCPESVYSISALNTSGLESEQTLTTQQ